MKLLSSNKSEESYKLVSNGKTIGTCKHIKWMPNTPCRLLLEKVSFDYSSPDVLSKYFDIFQHSGNNHMVFLTCFIVGGTVVRDTVCYKKDSDFETLTVQFCYVKFEVRENETT